MSSPVDQLSLVVLVVTSAILSLGLEAVSFIGANDFVDGVTSNTSDALRKLTPLEMAKRYDATCSNLGSGACRDTPFSAVRECIADHPNPTGGDVMLFSMRVLFPLVRQIFSESPTHSIVDLMPLIAGFSAMFAILARFNLLMHATSPGGLMIIVPVGILFTCLLSFRMLWLMHFVSIVVSGILPQAGASLFGGL